MGGQVEVAYLQYMDFEALIFNDCRGVTCPLWCVSILMSTGENEICAGGLH